MGCPCEIRAEADGPVTRALREAVAEVRRLDRTYSRWLPDSPWLRSLRAARSRRGAVLEDETLHLLRYALDAWRFTEGYFHPALLPLWRYWNRTGRSDAARVQALLQGCDPSRLHLHGRRLWLVDGLEPDLDGLVKEYAVDRALEVLVRHLPAARSLVVNLGGDVRVAGCQPARVGIVAMGGEPLSLLLRDRALASSGTRERGRYIGGRWFSHLIHPGSGWPLTGRALQLSVCAPTCLLAGTLSTAALLMGRRRGMAWLQAMDVPFLWQRGVNRWSYRWNDGA